MVQHFFRNIFELFIFVFDSILTIATRKQSEVKPIKKKILILRLDEIGDYILWLDTAKEYKKLYPSNHYEITLLGNSVWQDLANRLTYFDRSYFLNKQDFQRNLTYRYHKLRQIQKQNYDIIIQPRFSREFLLEDSIIRISKARERIGFNGDCTNIKPWQKRISRHWYTRLISASTGSLMELERNAEFIRGLGLNSFKAGIPELKLIDNHTISENLPDRYYILFPGAGKPFRQWPASSFAEFAEKFFQKTGMTGLICGGVTDIKTGNQISQQSNAKLINLCGKTSLLQLTTVIHNAALLVSNETCAVHIAAAVNTPCICILGGGNYGRFVPYPIEISIERHLPLVVYHPKECFGCNWKELSCCSKAGPVSCIDNISCGDVLNTESLRSFEYGKNW